MISTVKTRLFCRDLRDWHRDDLAESMKLSARRTEEQHLTGVVTAVVGTGACATPLSSALLVLAQCARSALSSPWRVGDYTNGWWGSALLWSSDSGRKRSLLHRRAELWEPQLLGFVSTRRLHHYGVYMMVQRRGCTACRLCEAHC